MSDRPRGCTGESCKESGTYVSERGDQQFFQEGQPFGCCPQTGQPTTWVKAT